MHLQLMHAVNSVWQLQLNRYNKVYSKHLLQSIINLDFISIQSISSYQESKRFQTTNIKPSKTAIHIYQVIIMSSMLKAARSTAFLNRISTNGGIKRTKLSASTRLMATQSGDDTKPPSALAKLHLEDGSTLTGRSFGCHESMTGEVRYHTDL